MSKPGTAGVARAVLLVIMLVAALGSCAPARSARDESGATSDGRPPAAPTPKVLTIGRLEEPATIEGFLGQGGTAGGAGDIRDLIHNHLTVLDPNDNPVAQLVTELPSVDNGLWRLNDDGSMDVTWHLRPGVRWHDGAPFTSEDMQFSFVLHKDPELAHAYGAVTRLMASASAPDPTTFSVHWSSAYPRALEALGLTPMPRHLLEELYRSDKDAFLKSPRFTTEFVGLGPYRLVRWDHGSLIELTRFDSYFRGRPPLDTVIVRFLFDQTTMLANILAGGVDLLTPPSVDLDGALEAKRRWEGTENNVRIEPVAAQQYLELQLQPQHARPTNGLPNRIVREALYRAIDRPSYAATVSQGYAPAADSWYAPRDPLRAELEDWIPKYPYDPSRAQSLLAQAGWERGPDGILVQPSGLRFEIEVLSNARQGEKPAVVIGEDWKAVGADARVTAVPPSRATDREYLSKFPGVLLARLPSKNMVGKADSRLISSAENRWSGSNRSGYTNPRADALLDELARTIDPRQQLQLQREQVRELMGDLAFYPLAWEVLPVLALKGVQGDIGPYNTSWNVFEWSKA